VRIDTERKLKALEADLEVAEMANKERAMAAHYHMHKFFGACVSACFALTLKFLHVRFREEETCEEDRSDKEAARR
jgi:hypothetical protein